MVVSWRQMWRSFGRHGVTYSAGEGISKGLIYLFLILLPGVLSQPDFAYVNLYITIVGLLTVPFAIGMPGALLRFFFHERPAVVLGTSGALTVAGALVLGAVAWFLRRPLADLLDLPQVLLSLAIAGAIANALRHGWLSALRAEQRSRLFAFSQVLEPLLLILGVGVMFAFHRTSGYVAVAIPYLATFVVIACGGWFYLARKPGLVFEKRLVTPLLALALPLVPHALASSGLATFDQIVVQQLLGAEATAIYAFGYRCGMVLYVVVLGFSSAWGPLLFAHLSGKARSGDLNAIARTYVYLLILGSLLLTVLVMAMAWSIGGVAYRDSLPLIPLVVYSYLWFALYTLASAYLVHAGRTVALAACSGTAFLLNAVLNYLLVPLGGLSAAAMATVGSYGFLFLLVLLALKGRPTEVRMTALALPVAAAGLLYLGAWRLTGGVLAPW